MKELVRCKPCGFVIEADKLGDVCPACGMPRTAFEPYRERVALNRLTLLGFDLHPITIHLSQTFVILIPGLIFLTTLFPSFQHELLLHVIQFAVYVFPLSLIAAAITGIIDGLFRFKTLNTPLLKAKLMYASIILILCIGLFFVARQGDYGITTIIISICCLGCAVKLGLLGKKLIDVILPGSYPIRKPKIGEKAIVNEE